MAQFTNFLGDRKDISKENIINEAKKRALTEQFLIAHVIAPFLI